MIRSDAGLGPVLSAACAFFLMFSAVAMAGPASQSVPKAEPAYRSYKKEIGCLARAIYFEARGEPWSGQRAVAQVILNRVKSEYYPDTICDVVYQNDHLKNACQFSFACDGIPDKIKEPEAFKRAELIARESFQCNELWCETDAPLARSTHYHADTVKPWWSKKLERTGQVGSHIFYYTATM